MVSCDDPSGSGSSRGSCCSPGSGWPPARPSRPGRRRPRRRSRRCRDRPRARNDDAERTGPSPLATTPTIRAPLEPNDHRFPINLATALRLSDARPIIVAAAQASVWVAEADLNQAKVLWLPAINLGFDYIRHDGGGPDFNKGILTSVSTNFFYAGAGLWGMPWGIISSTDAVFEPLVNQQKLNAAHWDVQRAKNDALMQTADAYFLVHQHRGTYAGTLYCIDRGHQLIERIATLSRDLVPEFEVERARNMVADLQQRAVSARQRWRVSSANLTQVLRLDPRSVVEPLEPDHLQVTLIDPGRTLEDLMPIALTNRPELAARPGAGPGGGGADPPGEDASLHPQHRAQRLPDPLRDAPGRHLRLRRQ